MKQSRTIFSILSVLFILSCSQDAKKADAIKSAFADVKGIQFSETRRAFDTGVAFNKNGFQLEPDWKMNFLSNDSVRLFNPLDNKSYNFYVHYDHDSVINMARVWLRIKKISRDSLKFQLLEVHGKNISGEGSNIYMTFYANRYIKDVLHTDAESLKKPLRKDSLYIRDMIKHAGDQPEKAFAASVPVELKSKSPVIKVERIPASTDPVMGQGLTDQYLSPEYNVLIKPAYKDFNYSFRVTVDTKGKMHFGKSTVYIMPEFEKSQNRVMKGIMEVYLQNLLDIVPGKTLGMDHPSEITLHVKGVKSH